MPPGKSSGSAGPGNIRPKLPKARPSIPAEDIASLLGDFEAILRSGQLTQGEYLQRFEQEFAAYIGVEHAVGLNSGTAPLEIAMRYWQVAGREVIVPTNTFMASANAVLLAGGTPVLADISAASLSSGLPQIRPQITAKTGGVVVVHIGGLILPDVDEIRAFCRERDLFLLEDAAHAHGAAQRGRRAGSLGDAASFSFFPTKVMTCGEGGMLTTDDEGLAAFARSFRSHGVAAEGRDLVRLGTNYRLPELSAALGLRQLGRLDEFVRERNHLARRYRERLQQVPGIGLFPAPADQVHSYYKFPVRLPSGCEGGEVLQTLKEGFGVVGGSLYWPPCHLQPFYRERFGYGEGCFPVAEEVLRRTITLPLFSGLTEREVDYVCTALQNVLESCL